MTQPRHVVCVLGPWKSFDAVTHIVSAVGGEGFRLDDEYSQLEPDDRMAGAFAASADRVDPSIGKADDRAIAKHRAVAYVLSPPLPAADAQARSAKMLAIIGALLADGALAVKAESAGIAHGAARWRDLANDARSTSLLTRATPSASRSCAGRSPMTTTSSTPAACTCWAIAMPRWRRAAR
jgi:hypothetical protein